MSEMRNHGMPSDIEQRKETRDHFALTDTGNKVQAFTEWVKSPVDSPFHGRQVHFTERQNMRGTVAHEAEHANDEKLGNPSLKDPEFDRLYQEDVRNALSKVKDISELGEFGYYIRPVPNSSDLDPQGKVEAFAELGAAILTGETASPNISVEALRAVFPKTMEYEQGKIRRGEW